MSCTCGTGHCEDHPAIERKTTMMNEHEADPNDDCELCEGSGEVQTIKGEYVGCPACMSREHALEVKDLQRQVQERDRLLEDAHQELLGNECGSPELHHAIQDILIESEQRRKPHER